jgi:hypothetical protein
MLTMLMRKVPLVLALTLAAALAFGMPVLAQDEDEDDSELIMVGGQVSFTADGAIMVAGYIIAPAGAFIPAVLREGDTVLIVGYLLPDGITIRALSLEIVEDEEEDEEESEDEDGEEVDDPDEEDTDLTRGFFCRDSEARHPAGARLARMFDVTYDEVMTAFCEEGYGFGEIMIAYLLARAVEGDVADIFALRQQGLGWGQIMQETGVHPREAFAGRAAGRGPWDADERPGGGPPADRGGGPPADRGNGRPPDGGGPPADRGGGRPAGPPPGRGGGRP